MAGVVMDQTLLPEQVEMVALADTSISIGHDNETTHSIAHCISASHHRDGFMRTRFAEWETC